MFAHTLRRFGGIAFATIALATAACGSDGEDSTGPSTPPPAADVSGTYALTGLRTLGNLGGGGNGLPVTFTDGSGSTLTFLSGELVMTGGAYTLEVEAEYNGGSVTLDDEGTYDATGGSIVFVSSGSPKRMKSAIVTGNAMTAQTQFGGIPFEIDLSK
jgi:hypothetical protein